LEVQLVENFPYSSEYQSGFEQIDPPPDNCPTILLSWLKIGEPDDPPSVTPWPLDVASQ